jgi:hypothetical protein
VPFRAALAAALAAALPPASLAAQATSSTIEAARTQIENIRPDSAIALLRRVPPTRGMPTEPRYWTLMGIAELLRGEAADAQAAFRRAIDADLALRVDSLTYLHSDIERVFAAARVEQRRAMGPASPVGVFVAGDTVLAPWQGRFLIELRPRLRSRVVLTVAPERDRGHAMWSDTLDVGAVATVAWDLQAQGDIVPPGRYVLRVGGVDVLRRVMPTAERTLTISRMPVDTLVGDGDRDAAPPVTAPPRLGRGSPGRLLVGAALGIGAASLTALAGNRSLNDGFQDRGRFVVAGAVSGAAIIGFLTGQKRRELEPPPAPPTRDVTPGERLIADENARRRATAPVRIQTGGAR